MDIEPSSALDLLLKDSRKYQTLMKSNVSYSDNYLDVNELRDIQHTFGKFFLISLRL